MDPVDIRSDRAGTVIDIPGGLCAFVPHPLAPQIRCDLQVLEALASAEQALGGVNAAVDVLPSPRLLLSPFLHLEASSSSRIEGSTVTWEQSLEAEVADRLPEDAEAREVLNYLSAIEVGVRELGRRCFGVDLVRGLHAELMQGVRGSHASPGELRQIQVFVGSRGSRMSTASYVPPPPSMIPGLLEDWQRYAQEDTSLPPLIQCALLHAQFEMIHPFRDGNGRVGRLLMSLFLIFRHHLRHPVLFLSSFFERHRWEYYDALRGVSHRGEWEEWILYFLTGVREESTRVMATARELAALREQTRNRLVAKRASPTALALLDALFENPYVTTNQATRKLGVTFPTARGAIAVLKNMGFIEEITGKKRGQRFCATPVLARLQAQTSND